MMEIILKEKDEAIKSLKIALEDSRRENSEIEKVFQMSLEAVAVERDEALKLNKGMDDLYLKLRQNVSRTLGPSYSDETQKQILDGISNLQCLIDKYVLEEVDGCYETCQSTLMHLRSCFETRMALQKAFNEGNNSSSSSSTQQGLEQCAEIKGLNQNQIEEQVGKMYQLLEKRDWATEFASLRKENLEMKLQCQRADAQLLAMRESVKDLVSILRSLDQTSTNSQPKNEDEGRKVATQIGDRLTAVSNTIGPEEPEDAQAAQEGNDQPNQANSDKDPESETGEKLPSETEEKAPVSSAYENVKEKKNFDCSGIKVQSATQDSLGKNESASALLGRAVKGILEKYEALTAHQDKAIAELQLAQGECLRTQAAEKVKLKKALACLKRRAVQLQGKLDYWKNKCKELEEEAVNPTLSSNRSYHRMNSFDSLNSKGSFAFRSGRDHSVDSTAGSIVGPEWNEIMELDPPPKTAANVASPIVQEVLNNWVNSKKKLVFEEWVQYIIEGGDVGRRGPGFAPALQISNLQTEVYQGFITLVLPLLLRRKDISVSVSTKKEMKPLHDLRVVVHPVAVRSQSMPQQRSSMFQSQSANQLAMKAAHAGYVEEGAKPYSAVAHTMKYGLVQTFSSIVGGK